MITILTEKDTQAVNKIIIDQLDVTPDQVTPDAKLIADLNADSLDIIQIAMSLEEHFQVSISDEQFDDIKTVGNVYEAIAEHLMQPGRNS